MKPIIKYRGGKSKEIATFKKYIPENFEVYYEPFFGGGATFFDLEPDSAYIADINEKLIRFYLDLIDNYTLVKKELKELEAIYLKNRIIFLENKAKHPKSKVKDPNEELYYWIRDQYNQKVLPMYSFATLYYFINKTAYSGMIRHNSKGEFNVPFGRYSNFNTDLLKENHFTLLSKADIRNESYENSFKLATENDFIFLDPPYDTVFSEYGNEVFSGDFAEENHRELAQNFKNLSSPALMIISETSLIRSLYKDYIKASYPKNYSVNIRNRFKSEANHLIITNYD
ncbi:DNA methyltransferase [Staphylococcus sp. HMSC068D08]|uniref:DNA adenine methylase n=1 Tax=Staphylococcus TaxID=1279 RepID=UPI0008A373FE|nr:MULTISPECIES: Dam family site-specific DNA-(adenine-N6)-methyltransferase [Staphylococcus]MCC2084265.1 Dam family site-specific DNA-(adenine-N6)-methyltransferase [Staphylococcus lugdunensis]MCH8680373.1 Dam family site-specific DNA-(adenine-N6)-methyltransferase [Staphylococcus lugdunensis]MCI2826772.1 Dam family site-specific DNA-(adenine-N6)-methyltransferase [Staphylococcus lugdunensis]MCI2836237.1 Dam family site-specific DNA-(adenine-N6)-methyltransferase [Staphylococcus lugdunensis]M